jgi:hypothetical protein
MSMRNEKVTTSRTIGSESVHFTLESVQRSTAGWLRRSFALLVLGASVASAGIGIGYDAMLGGVSGLSVQVPLSATTGVQVIGNAQTVDGELSWGFGVRGALALAAEGPVTLGVGLGGGLTGDPSGVGDPFFEAPLWIDYKFADHFSVTGQTGIVYYTSYPETLSLFNQGGANFLGAFAFHYWF